MPTYIYGLVDPRDGEVHYVGKTVDPAKRLAAHLSDSYNARKAYWVRELKKAGYRPKMTILEVVDRETWQEAEASWIRLAGAVGWPLTNMSKGGKGGANWQEQMGAAIDGELLPLIGHDLRDAIYSLGTKDRLEVLCKAACATMECFEAGVDNGRPWIRVRPESRQLARDAAIAEIGKRAAAQNCQRGA